MAAPRDKVDDTGMTLRRPAPGEVRPDYLADGTPVWVVGHGDASVSVLSAFDAHRPFNLGKVVWWCPMAAAFDNPEHGSKYDEYGLKLGGPAPSGLASYEIRVAGSRISVGRLGEAPAVGLDPTGPAEVDREWCHVPGDRVVFHTFDGWQAWDSPSDAVAAGPSGWILLTGSLSMLNGEVVVCARAGCDDAVRATNVEAPEDPNMEFGPFFGERFIARVRDGALTDVTRVLPWATP